MNNTKQLNDVDTTEYGIYFANLGAYNSGSLVGGWLYPLQYDSFENFAKAIKSITRNADEVAIHDYDNFPDMGEYPNHEQVYNLAHALEQSSLSSEVLIKHYDSNYYGNYEDLEDEINSIEDSYIGEYDSFDEYANEIADQDIECLVNQDARDFVYRNFDYKGHARDLEHSYTVIKLDNYNVAIFDE
jgi:antirestriction protein